jgi:hypothetical protein
MATPTRPAAGRLLPAVRAALVGTIAVLVLVVGAGAFLASFEAISAYAVAIGAFPPGLWWVPPLLVDTFITVGTAAFLWLSLTTRPVVGRYDTWYARALIALGAGVSVAINVAHAPDHLAARLVAALPPVALLLSVELLMLIASRILAESAVADSARDHAPAHVATLAPMASGESAAPAQTATGVAAASRAGRARPRRSAADTRPVYQALAARGTPVTWQVFAAAFDPPMPRRTALRHLAAHQADLSPNGHRPSATPERRSEVP